MKSKSEKKEKQKFPAFYSILNRIILFLCAFIFVVMIFYVIGCLNHFLDSSLIIILQIIQISSVACFLCSICSFFLSIILAILKKRLSFLLFIIPLLLVNIYAIFCFVFSGTIDVMATGTY